MSEKLLVLPSVAKKRKICATRTAAYFDTLSKEELVEKILELEVKLKKQQRVEEDEGSQVSERMRKKKRPRPYDFSKCNFRHVAFKLLYLGWDYDGFVTQDNTANTIEHHLFNALVKACLIENREKSNYHRCGRTDRGVSAFSQVQVISLTIRSQLEEEDTEAETENELPYCKMLNALLPKDIRIIAWAPVPAEFSARFSCTSRTYKYWFPRGDLNITKMKEAVRLIIGYHDFRNLCKMDVANGVTNFHRRIRAADVTCNADNELEVSDGDGYGMAELTIVADGFLWHQIRAIVSVLFLVGQNKEKPSIFSTLLDVDNCPRKPQYSISAALPLNLFDCEFKAINWRQMDKSSLREVIQTLQSFWTCTAVKCHMLRSMLTSLESILPEGEASFFKQYEAFFRDVNSKIYKPLTTRPTAASLEDRISHYIKKGKLPATSTSKLNDG